MPAFQFNYLLVTLSIRRKINRMCAEALDRGSVLPRLASNSKFGYLEMNKA